MGKMGEQNYASRFRDTVTRIAKTVINTERPDVRMGKVYRFDQEEQTAWVLFPGESVENLVRVRVARNMQPTLVMEDFFPDQGYESPGDIVRVWGKPGNYFILDFYTGAPASEGTVAGAEPVVSPGTIGDYYRGDKTWQPLTPSAAGLTDVALKSGSQTFTGTNRFDIPLRLGDRGSDPIGVASLGQLYSKGGKPFWVDSSGIARPLIEPRQAIHEGANFEEWEIQQKTSGQETIFPVGWTPFWQNDDVVNSQSLDSVSGVYSLKVHRPAGSAMAARVHSQTVFIVNPGDTVTFEIFAKASSSGAYVGIALLTSTTSNGADYFSGDLRIQERNINLTSTWNKYTVSYSVPQGDHYARFSLWPTTLSTIAAFDFYFDDSGSEVTIPAGGAGTITGEIKLWPGGTVPEGYLPCDGTVYNNAEYPALAGVCQNFWGGVPGSSFAVPDMRLRIPVGVGTGLVVGSTDAQPEGSRSLIHSHGAGTLSTDSFGHNSQLNTTAGGGSARLTGPINHSHDVTGSTADSAASAFPFGTFVYMIKT